MLKIQASCGGDRVSCPDLPLNGLLARCIRYNEFTGMKARVFVSFKKTVLDPQGQTIRSALVGRGYQAITDVRQGKVFDIDLAEETDRTQAQKQLEEIAREVLANPVIEEYRVELLD